MAIREMIMYVTGKTVGYSYLYNYQSYKRYGPPGTYPGGSAGIYGYQPDKLDTKSYLVPTYQMDLYVVDICDNKTQMHKVGEFEVVRFAIDNKIDNNGKNKGVKSPLGS